MGGLGVGVAIPLSHLGEVAVHGGLLLRGEAEGHGRGGAAVGIVGAEAGLGLEVGVGVARGAEPTGRTIEMFLRSRSSRLSPGLRGMPDVTITSSEPLVMP